MSCYVKRNPAAFDYYGAQPVTGRRAVRNDEPILARFFAENDSKNELVFGWESWFLISCSKENPKCVNVFQWGDFVS